MWSRVARTSLIVLDSSGEGLGLLLFPFSLYPPCEYTTESYPTVTKLQPSAGAWNSTKDHGKGSATLGHGRDCRRSWQAQFGRTGFDLSGPLLTHLICPQVFLQLQHLLQRLGHHTTLVLQELQFCLAQAEETQQIVNAWELWGQRTASWQTCRFHLHGEDMALGQVD